jgi:hypothetical protein
MRKILVGWSEHTFSLGVFHVHYASSLGYINMGLRPITVFIRAEVIVAKNGLKVSIHREFLFPVEVSTRIHFSSFTTTKHPVSVRST